MLLSSRQFVHRSSGPRLGRHKNKFGVPAPWHRTTDRPTWHGRPATPTPNPDQAFRYPYSRPATSSTERRESPALPCPAPVSSLLAHIWRKHSSTSARARPSPSPSPSRRPNTDAEVRSSRRQGPAQERPDGPRRRGRSARPWRPGGPARPRSWSRKGSRRPRPADDGRSAQGPRRPRSGSGRGEGDAAHADEGRPGTRSGARSGPGDDAAAAASQ